MSSVTCVSGYWKVDNKHNDKDFTTWFETTLRINCPYVFFGTKETIELAKKYRRELPTHYIELYIEEFYTYKYKDKMKTDPIHCPSVELNLIWNEKIFLVEKAKMLNVFNSEFFMWVDAGVCSLRNEAPSTEKFPNLEKLSLLPTNKLIFTSSNNPIYEPEKLGDYYHFISGTAYLLHNSVIETVSALYRVYMDKYIELNNIYTDQIILTYMYNDFPDLFHQIGNGYGELVNILVPSEINNFVICGVFKNESHILSEWIQHYINRGVDHIYLVNDNSTDDYDSFIKQYSDKVTVFQNDIVTRDVGRQTRIYDKYFRTLLTKTKWMAILDLDEFLYSPTGETFVKILSKYDNIEQLKVDWLYFGSNGHKFQPISVVSGFTQRAKFSTKSECYAYKCIFKTSSLISFGIHINVVKGNTLHLAYDDNSAPPLVINHYQLQSYNFFINVKATRGDCDNWFDTQKLCRDESLFKKFDINEVTDLRLFEQNKGKVSFDSSIGSNDDVTLIITSCNRPHLLDKTLETFVKMNTYPISITYLIDDSGVIGCNDTVVEKYSKVLNIISIYNSVNIGQVQSIDKVYAYVRTKWIFHCEEDWCFLKPNFIEKSMTVFNENPNEKIYTVWLRPHSSTSGHPIIKDDLNRGYYMMKKDFSYMDKGIKYTWGGITFNPGLRKTSDCLLFHPYSFCCEKIIYNGKEYIGEYTINKAYVESGFYAMILSEPSGHLDHIGWGEHIKRDWE